ncbi:MAG TPA: alpha/beta hydrolase [Thermoanaerobaculia bacterium]|nr:alpha/beta hydrolase [Thermoanaerobaculia bacterium]
MPFAGVRDQRFYYEVGGEGELVILLHGALANADLMEAPATGLASGFRALRFDRRGCGRTTPPTEGPVPLPEEAVEKAHFLAHDEGAEVALEFALRNPGRTGSIALLAPSLEGFSSSPDVAAAAADLRAALRSDAPKALEEKLLPSPIFDAAREREGVFDRIADIFRRFPQSPGRFERLPRAGAALAGRLGAVSARTFVLVGERDEEDRLRSPRGSRARSSSSSPTPPASSTSRRAARSCAS